MNLEKVSYIDSILSVPQAHSEITVIDKCNAPSLQLRCKLRLGLRLARLGTNFTHYTDC